MKKLLSAILALALLLSVWSFPVVAEDGQAAEEPAVGQEAAQEETGEEEGEEQEGTLLVIAEDPEPEAEEPEAEEPVAEEPEAEEPEAEEPVKEEPVAEEPEAEEPEAEEPVKEEPVAEEPEAEEPEAEEPVKEEPVAEEPEAEEPEAEEPVKEEPVAEEPEAEKPVAEEPVAEEPVAEEPVAEEPVKEGPVKEEPVAEEPEAEEPVAEEPVAEEPVAEAPVHFEQGYVSVKKGAKAYAEASKKEEYGLFTADAVVYAESEKQQDDPAKDWLKITFAADGALETAYVQAGTVKALEAGEIEALEAKLEKDAEAKEYKGHKLPFVSFVKPEAPVAEETVTKEATGHQEPAEEEEAEEVTLEAVEEEAPKATEEEAAPKQEEAAPEQEDVIAVKETAKVSAAVTPRVASGALDETVSFGIVCKNATGKTSYQWQATADGGKTWEDLAGNTAAALNILVTEESAQKKYRCLVTTDEGTAVSNECRINGTLSVRANPAIRAVDCGGTVSFKAEVSFASGKVKYQWQESKNNGRTWSNSSLVGSKTKSLKIRAKKDTLPKTYRCVVTAGGKKATSNVIKICGARIPQTDKTAKVGDKISLNANTFHMTGKVKYQWQVSTDKGKTWKNTDLSGNKTSKLTVTCSSVAKLKNYYRCKVTCDLGTVYTNAVHFKGKLAVSIERNKTGISVGATAKFVSAVAFNDGTVTYKWQYSTDNGSTWKNDSSLSGKSPSFTLSDSKLTRLYRLSVKDRKGNTAKSNTIRLIDFTLGQTKPVYRALLIGEEDFDPICTRNRGDVNHFAAKLAAASAPGGTKYQVTKKFDLDYYDVQDAIQATFKDTKDSDVSIFMIATHGYSTGDGDLSTVGYYNYSISFRTLAYWLNTYVKGKVIVILESCGSGSAIYEEGVSENAASMNAANEAFVERAVAAFSAADKGVTETVANMEFDDDGELVVNTGELRTNKFYVLTASRHHELSWGHESGEAGNYFIDWLVEGIGTKSKSPADASPKNKVLTLEELFSYVKKYNNHTFWDGYDYYTQHAQRYPKNSKYPVLMFP